MHFIPIFPSIQSVHVKKSVKHNFSSSQSISVHKDRVIATLQIIAERLAAAVCMLALKTATRLVAQQLALRIQISDNRCAVFFVLFSDDRAATLRPFVHV